MLSLLFKAEGFLAWTFCIVPLRGLVAFTDNLFEGVRVMELFAFQQFSWARSPENIQYGLLIYF